jgi:uncharacterized membrane protein
MNGKAAITVLRTRDDVRRLWETPEHTPQHVRQSDARVSFKDAPGDRGTEIHVELGASGDGNGAGGVLQKLSMPARLAKVKDELRRFKAWAETGEVPRSEGSPEGELAERKLKQRPAQPLDDSELERAGVA